MFNAEPNEDPDELLLKAERVARTTRQQIEKPRSGRGCFMSERSICSAFAV
jgi:hypothetical protein